MKNLPVFTIRFTSKFKKGFTLIELLIVIAIIGILSGIVLASLNTAKDKGRDSKVISEVTSLRTQGEIYYGDNGNSYNDFFVGNNSWDSAIPKVKMILDDIAAADADGIFYANSAPDYWVAVAQLPSTIGTTTAFWCADNKGMSKQWGGPVDPDATLTACQ